MKKPCKEINYLYKSLVGYQIWISICFTSLVYFFQKSNQWNSSLVLLLSFFGTLSAYNLAYWVENKKMNFRFFIIVLSALISIFCFFQLKFYSQIIIAFSGILSFLYSFPIKGKRLRELPFFKIFCISLVWSMVAVISYSEKVGGFSKDMIQVGFITFLFVFGITIPFDLRDRDSDSFKLRTIPQMIGEKYSKLLSVSSLILSVILFYISKGGHIDLSFYAFLIGILWGMALIIFQNQKFNKWYVAFWIEGISAVPLFLLSIFQNFN